MVDLHTHSRASDGSLAPGDLVRAAAAAGVTALALTDHDTVAGVPEAATAASESGVRLIPGVELEISWEPGTSTVAPPGEFHLLGLGLRDPSPALLSALGEMAAGRERRNREILLRLGEEGLRADYGDLLELAGDSVVGRPHIAELLVRHGLARNIEQAFDRFLGKGKPCYVARQGMRFGDALELVRGSGGISVLAHPLSLFVSWGRLPGLVGELAEQGLSGIEAWHPRAKGRSCLRLEQLGQDLGLFVTEGSDFHGASRPDSRLGYSSRSRKIDEEVLERIPPLSGGR